MSADAHELNDTEADLELDSMLRKVARIDEVARPPAEPVPTQIIGGKYRLEELLGRGGMGVVFRATHLVSHKALAIKWMLGSTGNELAHKRFVREALASGRIDHPNVVDVYDVGQEGEGAYLVMELLHGESLRKRLQRGPLSAVEAVCLLLPAMRGVAAVHRAGVIHRDLKPDNVFLCTGPEGEAREAKVLDFGISSVLANAGSDPTLTSPGTLMGTPAYMSPEQLACASDIDARADVYAFGVMFYEALAGELPYPSSSLPKLAFAIAHEPLRPLRELCPDVPPELERIVQRALAKRRTDRYPDMERFMQALAGVSPRAAGLVSRDSRPRRSLLTAAGLAALGLCGTLAAELWPSAMTAPQNSDAAQSSLEAQAVLAARPYPLHESASETSTSPVMTPDMPAPSVVAGRALPRSCAEARAAGRPMDKDLKIDPDGPGPVKAFEVRCAAGPGAVAREYLALASPLEGNLTRFSYGTERCACPDLVRRFTHVRIDPRTLTIDPTDGTFASYDRSLECEAQHRSQCGEQLNLRWGGAGSCRAPGDVSGSASIDLRHTGFALARNVQFVPSGFGAAGSATISHDRRTAKLVGGGQCGSMVAEAATVALVQER